MASECIARLTSIVRITSLLTLVNIAIFAALLTRGCPGEQHGGEAPPPDTVRTVDTLYLRDTVRSVAYVPTPARIITDTVRATILRDSPAQPRTIRKAYYHDVYRDSNLSLHIHDTLQDSRIASRRIEYTWDAPYRIRAQETITKHIAAPPRLRPVAGIWGLSNGTIGLEMGLEYGRFRVGVLGGYGGQWAVGGRIAIGF